jgi:hypothetical protein
MLRSTSLTSTSPKSGVRAAAIFVSLVAFTSPAIGEEVSGRVYLDNQPFSGRLKLPDGSEIGITGGIYRIFVPAGDYAVTFEHLPDGRPYAATIQSSTVPVTRDIYLSTK